MRIVESHSHLVAVLGRGVVADPDEPVLSAFDMGLTRGDGCFDATRIEVADDGSVHVDHLDAHLDRLVRSARALALPPVDLDAWRELVAEALAAWQRPGEAVLRVLLSRGSEWSGDHAPTGVLTIAPLPETSRVQRRGISVVTLSLGRRAEFGGETGWLLGGVKTLSYAVNMAAAREAARRGADDALFVSTEGLALEGPRSALIWRVGDHLVTTRVDGTGILASVTQASIFDEARRTHPHPRRGGRAGRPDLDRSPDALGHRSQLTPWRAGSTHSGFGRARVQLNPLCVDSVPEGRQPGGTLRSLTQLPWNPNGTRWGSGTWAT
jgi:4-amino-4-deoxychorismate lyase